jgi:hypothetical protein
MLQIFFYTSLIKLKFHLHELVGTIILEHEDVSKKDVSFGVWHGKYEKWESARAESRQRDRKRYERRETFVVLRLTLHQLTLHHLSYIHLLYFVLH